MVAKAPLVSPKPRGRTEADTPQPGLASERLRQAMCERLQRQGIADTEVLQAMRRVPRHAFVDPALASRAYEDTALPIGHRQTISQPFVVARSLSVVRELYAGTDPMQRVLEVGTGCGYQAAVMAQLFPWVASIERIEALHQQARRNLAPLALSRLHLIFGDGLEGLPAYGPYSAMVLAAGIAEVPEALLLQLAAGGVLVAPVGGQSQRLVAIRRRVLQDGSTKWETHAYDEVSFVPMLAGVVR